MSLKPKGHGQISEKKNYKKKGELPSLLDFAKPLLITTWGNLPWNLRIKPFHVKCL
jgi:hypothetical protein